MHACNSTILTVLGCWEVLHHARNRRDRGKGVCAHVFGKDSSEICHPAAGLLHRLLDTACLIPRVCKEQIPCSLYSRIVGLAPQRQQLQRNVPHPQRLHSTLLRLPLPPSLSSVLNTSKRASVHTNLCIPGRQDWSTLTWAQHTETCNRVCMLKQKGAVQSHAANPTLHTMGWSRWCLHLQVKGSKSSRSTTQTTIDAPNTQTTLGHSSLRDHDMYTFSLSCHAHFMSKGFEVCVSSMQCSVPP